MQMKCCQLTIGLFGNVVLFSMYMKCLLKVIVAKLERAEFPCLLESSVFFSKNFQVLECRRS